MTNEEIIKNGKPDEHMIPLGDYVVIEKGDECAGVTKSGIILTNPEPDEKEFGILKTFWPDCKIVNKDLVGKIIVTRRLGKERKYKKDNTEYFLCPETEIIAYYA